MSTKAQVTPQLLRWARVRGGLDTKEASERLKVHETELESWERGDARPTIPQAEDFAERLHVPFGYLFLSEPPSEQLDIPDLRTIGSGPLQNPSPDLIAVLTDALAKQEWYRRYVQSNQAEPLSFIGSFSTDDPPELIGADIRTKLQITADVQSRSANAEDFLRMLVVQTEALGVLVLRSGIVGNNTHRRLDVQEFRGFTLTDQWAPVIFINTRDAKAAQVFTVAHELAHLWLGQSGVSNPDYRRPGSEPSPIERVANRVAAEALVPTDEFLSRWQSGKGTGGNIRTLATHFRVSRLVALRRALDLALISRADYWQAYDQLESVVTEPVETKERRGNFYNTFYTRNSRRFTESVITALGAEHVTYLDAARLLNVKVATLDKVLARVHSM